MALDDASKVAEEWFGPYHIDSGGYHSLVCLAMTNEV